MDQMLWKKITYKQQQTNGGKKLVQEDWTGKLGDKLNTLEYSFLETTFTAEECLAIFYLVLEGELQVSDICVTCIVILFMCQ